MKKGKALSKKTKELMETDNRMVLAGEKGVGCGQVKEDKRGSKGDGRRLDSGW